MRVFVKDPITQIWLILQITLDNENKSLMKTRLLKVKTLEEKLFATNVFSNVKSWPTGEIGARVVLKLVLHTEKVHFDREKEFHKF